MYACPERAARRSVDSQGGHERQGGRGTDFFVLLLFIVLSVGILCFSFVSIHGPCLTRHRRGRGQQATAREAAPGPQRRRHGDRAAAAAAEDSRHGRETCRARELCRRYGQSAFHEPHSEPPSAGPRGATRGLARSWILAGLRAPPFTSRYYFFSRHHGELSAGFSNFLRRPSNRLIVRSLRRHATPGWDSFSSGASSRRFWLATLTENSVITYDGYEQVVGDLSLQMGYLSDGL